MDRDLVRELHYITHVDNVASMMLHGILAHNAIRERGLVHVTVAMAEIQERRHKQVPGGRRLHDYANLYFNARNPMMFKRIKDVTVGPKRLTVLRVDPAVLEIQGTVIADKNASSDYVMFHEPNAGVAVLDAELVFAEWWTDDDPIEQYRKRAAICAEVLVPQSVPARFIFGAYAPDDDSAAEMRRRLGGDTTLDIVANPHIFFCR